MAYGRGALTGAPANAAVTACAPRSSANSLQQKLYNWNTLNTKVFRKLGFQLPREDQTQ